MKQFWEDRYGKEEFAYGEDPNHWDNHMKELVLNFEIDSINDELLKTMGELRKAEKDGDNTLVAKMAIKCQELSKKKAQINKP